ADPRRPRRRGRGPGGVPTRLPRLRQVPRRGRPGVVPRHRPQHLPDVAPAQPPAETDRPLRRGAAWPAGRGARGACWRRGAPACIGGAAARVPRGRGVAGVGGPVVQGGRRGDGRADRDGHVATVPRPGPAATNDDRPPTRPELTGDSPPCTINCRPTSTANSTRPGGGPL